MVCVSGEKKNRGAAFVSTESVQQDGLNDTKSYAFGMSTSKLS